MPFPMRFVLPLTVLAACLTIGTASASAAEGELDLTFGAAGLVLTNDPTTAVDVAVQPNGRVVTVGTKSVTVPGVPYASIHSEIQVSRFTRGGTLDTSFGTGGSMQVWPKQLPFPSGVATSVVLQPDGKVLVGGTDNADFLILRLTRDGALDTTFGGDGIVTADLGGFADAVKALSLQADGRIVAAGSGARASTPATNLDPALIRLNPDGELDPTFGVGGKVLTTMGAYYDVIAGLAIQPDGSIVGAGSTAISNTNRKLAIYRYDASGRPDPSFDGDGVAMRDIATGSDNLLSVALTSSGKIVANGISGGTTASTVLVRYLSNGQADPSFDGDGLLTDPAPGWAADILVQADDKIVTLGYYIDGDYDFTVTRRESNGSLDPTFGTAGQTTVSFGAGNETPAGMARAPGGGLVLAGTKTTPTSGSPIFQTALTRLTAPADSTPPTNPDVTSPSHSVGVRSLESVIKVEFDGATDNLGDVSGYSYSWSRDPSELPDAVMDAEIGVTTASSNTLTAGSHYFHIRTVDPAGNWSEALHVGPYVTGPEPAPPVVTPPVVTPPVVTPPVVTPPVVVPDQPTAPVRPSCESTVLNVGDATQVGLSWKASTDRSIDRYEVAHEMRGSEAGGWLAHPSTSTAMDAGTYFPGDKVELHVRAVARSGLTSKVCSRSVTVAQWARIVTGSTKSELKGTESRDLVVGSKRDERVHGGGGSDSLDGGAGNDAIFGDAGDDWVRGGAGKDKVSGGAGDDRVEGGHGSDKIGGGAGRDVVRGGDGDDDLSGGAGRDELSGGWGDDVVHAHDGTRDHIDCGTGWDIAFVDKGDHTTRCEWVVQRQG